MNATTPPRTRRQTDAGVLQPHPGHHITVTRDTVNGAWLECTCGLQAKHGSTRAATISGLRHHHAIGGCNCPPQVVALPYHFDPAA